MLKKPISYGLVRKRGGGKPPGLNQNRFFFVKKGKDAECSEMEKYAEIVCLIFVRVSVKNLDIFPGIFIKYWKYFPLEPKVFFLSWKTYVLDHSASYNMHIENCRKKYIFFKSPQKKRFLPYGGGGGGPEPSGLVLNF